MEINKLGQVTLTTDEAIVSLLKGSKIDNWVISNESEQQLFEDREHFLGGSDQILLSYKEEDDISFHENNQSSWMIDEYYLNMDIEQYLLDMCDTTCEQERVANELVLFNQKGLYPILKLMVFLTDIKKKNDIVWGVGRGSSVASYCLYLIGVHKVNSLQFNLDIKEFLH